MEPRNGHAIGVLDGVALRIIPDQRPERLETAGLMGLLPLKKKRNNNPARSTCNSVMSSGSQANAQDADGLEAAVDQAIAVCDGDMRSTIRAMIVANEYLESEVRQTMKE